MVGGPHESSDGRAVTIEEREIGMLNAVVNKRNGDRCGWSKVREIG